MDPALTDKLRWFGYRHLSPSLHDTADPFSRLAKTLAERLDGPEAVKALDHLLVSRDCAVRAAIEALDSADRTPDSRDLFDGQDW